MLVRSMLVPVPAQVNCTFIAKLNVLFFSRGRNITASDKNRTVGRKLLLLLLLLLIVLVVVVTTLKIVPVISHSLKTKLGRYDSVRMNHYNFMTQRFVNSSKVLN